MVTRLLSVLLLASSVILSSCVSSVNVQIPVQRPPEVNVSSYKRIVVDPIESSSYNRNDGAAVRNAILEKLLASRLFDAVSDTKSFSNESNSTVVLSGAVATNDYSERSTHTQQLVERKVRTADGKRDTVVKDSVVHQHDVNGKLRFSTQLRLRDLSQNAIIWSTTYDLERSATNSALNSKPGSIAVPVLERSLIDEISDRLVQSFMSRTEMTTIRLLQDSDLPELEAGNDLAKKSLWQEAANQYNKAILKHPGHELLHKALYDYACACMAIGNYETAERNFRKAIDIAPGEDLYSNTLLLCQRMKDETAMLKRYYR